MPKLAFSHSSFSSAKDLSFTVLEKNRNIVAIIPARGGSKEIPRKNLIDFCGKPLLAWSIQQAASASSIRAVYVSTDDDEIKQVALEYGAKVITRPKELAADTSSSESALKHAIADIEDGGEAVDLVVFLQATSPLRDWKDVEGAIQTLLKEKADSLFSAALLKDFCVWSQSDGGLQGLTFDPWNRGLRQNRKPLLLENGSIYVFKPYLLKEHDNRLGGKIAHLEMPYWKSYEIDSASDIEICEYYFRKHLLAEQNKSTDAILTSGEIDLVVYDFDGVMTDNRVVVSQDGNEAVLVNRADGLGVGIIRKLGIRQLILSTEKNPVVSQRAKKLDLEVIQGCDNKAQALTDYAANHHIQLRNTAYIGNDVNDLQAMKLVGYPVAPSDAHPEAKRVAKIITSASGGNGVVKEFAEMIAAARNVSKYRSKAPIGKLVQ